MSTLPLFVAEPGPTTGCGDSSRWFHTFDRRNGRIFRTVAMGDRVVTSWLEEPMANERNPQGDGLLSAWWAAYLSGARPRSLGRGGRQIRAADIFCGAGGLAQGVTQLACEIGRPVSYGLVVDSDPGAVATFRANHDVRMADTRSVTSLVDYRVRGHGRRIGFAYPPELLDDSAVAALRGVELLAAGPPCQGHSSLNNRSRGRDPRNQLILAVAAFAVAAAVPRVIIENVPRVVRDAAGVVATVRRLLRSEGYRVTEGVLAADAMGWPQTRRRYFMVACRGRDPVPLDDVAAALADPGVARGERSVSWLLAQVGRRRATGIDPEDPLQTATAHTETNQARIDWLFENDEYDLPDSRRPDCHQDGTTYGAVYGRMRPDRPAPTITTGFTSPGRGRFVHPTERRAITPREAATIQGFPLDYRFVGADGRRPSRTQLTKWIGDAVPMPLGYAAALSALGGG